MKNLLFLLTFLLIVFFWSCTPSNNLRKGLAGVKVLRPFPFFTKYGDVRGLDTSISYVYYYGDKTLYAIEHKWIHTENGDIIDHGTDTSYFVVTNGKKEGFYYDKLNKQSGIKKGVDSTLKTEYVVHKDFYNLISQSGVIEVKNEVSKDGKKKQIIYSLSAGRLAMGEILGGKTDSISYEFSDKFKDIPYSLSPHFDSSTNLKLWRVTIINSPLRLFADSNVVIQRFEQTQWLEDLKIEDPKPILFYFLDAERREKD